MKAVSRRNLVAALAVMLGSVLIAATGFAAEGNMKQIPSGQKAKVKGKITSRSGDLVYVSEVKTDATVVVAITDDTKIDRKKSKYVFFRKADMDVTAMLPGLTIEAEGMGNAKGQLEAKHISFYPDTFAIEVAQEQQILSNRAAAADAQSTANEGVANAAKAQSSANNAQGAANVAGATAALAAEGAIADGAAIKMVNQRVSNLGDYSTVAQAGIYFASDSDALDDAAKADLNTLAAALAGAPNYLIEVAGYASSTGTPQLNQKLSEERAAVVVNYLRQQGNVPMRRFVVPAGYGALDAAAPNSDPQGRALNRRVDVKIIVNKGLSEAM